MYRIDRNNYNVKPKTSTIYTPNKLSDYIFDLLNDFIKKDGYIFDPCVGRGSLLIPWKEKGYKVFGVDIIDQGFQPMLEKNYLDLSIDDIKSIKYLDDKMPNLIVINPPFNIDENTIKIIKEKKYGSARPFLPEVWLDKAIELFGKNIPILIFTPYGFRLNSSIKSGTKRRDKLKTHYPEISSIISLPKDIYDQVMFHSEILIFNVKGIKPHYTY